MKYSVCTDALFPKLPTENAIGICAKLGYEFIEFWHLGGKNIQKIKEECEKYGVKVNDFCTLYNNLVEEEKRSDFIDGLKKSIETAKFLDCKKLIVTTGNEISGLSRGKMHESIVEGLAAASKIAAESEIMLVLEPLNVKVNHMGYYLSSSKEAFDIVKEVANPYVKVLFDYYHQSITEGDLVRTTVENIDYIGHTHIAANPGRGEFFSETSEINYKAIFDALKESKYTGCVGLEYFINSDPEESLKQAKIYYSL